MAAGAVAPRGVELVLERTGPMTTEMTVKATIIQPLAARLSYSPVITIIITVITIIIITREVGYVLSNIEIPAVGYSVAGTFRDCSPGGACIRNYAQPSIASRPIKVMVDGNGVQQKQVFGRGGEIALLLSVVHGKSP